MLRLRTSEGVGAVVTTYQSFGGADHRADAARVFDLLKRTRTARGLPAPAALANAKGLATEASLVNRGEKEGTTR
jgi:hypothetical protein